MREWLKTMRTEQGMTMKDLSRKLAFPKVITVLLKTVSGKSEWT